ncbi:MAG: quinolinate synthase NadA [Oscillospiraceae bacterium]|nr:quinolinate synthase NadA [Oscillospiraceae bacterium]
MTVKEVQDKILKLKQEKDICILAHSYQAREIIEIADFSGDSYQLSVAASKTDSKTVIMCGVRFMAETVKLLSPEKTVLLSHPEAGCPMAEQMDKALISAVKGQFPEYTVVAYINTTAELKTICDVCVTSSSAVKIVNNIENKNILFLPDCNLGAYVAQQVPDKNVKLLQGGCPIHAAVNTDDVRKAKERHPEALLLVHPECVPEVVKCSDYVGSTSGIMEYAMNSKHKEFIIGTELSIAENLQYRCPEKRFYGLSHKLMCPNMRINTLVDVLNCVKGDGGEEIILDEATIRDARMCIDKMIELS